MPSDGAGKGEMIMAKAGIINLSVDKFLTDTRMRSCSNEKCLSCILGRDCNEKIIHIDAEGKCTEFIDRELFKGK